MSRLAGKVRVEPLDPARLARIEDRVMAGRAPVEAAPARPGWPRWAAMAAAACALLVLAGGIGWWLGGGGRGAAAGGPAPVVATGPGEGAALEIGDARVQVAPGSRVAVREVAGGGTRLELEGGRVDCEVAPRQGRPPFVVRAGDVDVTVVG
ncbi:MAG TPA: FecR domain-containing protein, partial [Kofleriaceae bacterium]|nr:FecR domain-containing protein [Kofleriaceae bacterium]